MSTRTQLREPHVTDIVSVYFGLSPREIATQLGASRTGVLGRLKRMGILVFRHQKKGQ